MTKLFLFGANFVGYRMLLLYVDDIVILSDAHINISKLKQYLSKRFEMKDLG